MVDKTSRAVVLKPDKTSSLLECGLMFFSYANFQRSQKHHCYQLSWHTPIPGMFSSPFKKLAARVCRV